MRELILIKCAQDVKENEMCVHHWEIDSHDKGVCKKCGEEKDFSQPVGRLTRKEFKFVNNLGKGEYYMQGILHTNRINKQDYLE